MAFATDFSLARTVPHSPQEGVTGTSAYRFEYNLYLIKIPSHVNRESITTKAMQLKLITSGCLLQFQGIVS